MRKVIIVLVAACLTFATTNVAHADDNAILGIILGGTIGLIIGNEIGRDNDHRPPPTRHYPAYVSPPPVYMIPPPPPPRRIECGWVIVGYDRYGRPVYQQHCW